MYCGDLFFIHVRDGGGELTFHFRPRPGEIINMGGIRVGHDPKRSSSVSRL